MRGIRASSSPWEGTRYSPVVNPQACTAEYAVRSRAPSVRAHSSRARESRSAVSWDRSTHAPPLWFRAQISLFSSVTAHRSSRR